MQLLILFSGQLCSSSGGRFSEVLPIVIFLRFHLSNFNFRVWISYPISEVRGVKPKVPRPGIRVPSSTSSRYRLTRTRRVTCVTCVACRACDVARDRSIGRVRSEGPEIDLRLRQIGRMFLLLLLLFSVARVPCVSFFRFCAYV